MKGERKQRPIWVVKIGGSLFDAADLKAWLEVLSAPPASEGAAHKADSPAVVIVPGGGPFAGSVRLTQPVLGFGDRAAHRMALLAMEQYAIALADLQPRLRLASSADELARLRHDGKTAVWMPSRMVLGWYDVPESWEVTSDSLAAWLATELRAHMLVLVKSAPLPESGIPAQALVEQGIVDRCFPDQAARFLEHGKGGVWCLSRTDHVRFGAALAGKPMTGLPVTTRTTVPS